MWRKSAAQIIIEVSKKGQRFSTHGDISDVPAKFPLDGIRVMDLTRIVAGPFCTQILSDLGAEVIKVEKPFAGDESRKWAPPEQLKTKGSSYFMAVNRNKKSVCIDLKRGRDVIYDLVKRCDVLVENYVPGKLDELGLSYQTLKEISPSLIYCSISGFGPVGPYAKKPGFDVIAASMGGLMSITGPEDGAPCKVGVAMTDIATGLYAHGAILAALFHRDRTGFGQKIDVNLFSTQLACLINAGSNWLNDGVVGKRWGTAHSSIVPYESFKTADGYITIGAGSNEQFQALCELLEASEVAKDPLYVDNSRRVQNRTKLIAILSAIIEKRTNKEWMEVFKDASFPAGPINTLPEVFEDEHVKEIGIVKSLPHPAGEVKVVGPPVLYSNILNEARFAPPRLGEHTVHVLKELLNYDDGKIDRLKLEKSIA